MSDIKLKAASGGGSISIKGPSSAGSDTDFLAANGNLTVTGTSTLTGNVTGGGDINCGTGYYQTTSGTNRFSLTHDGANCYLENQIGSFYIKSVDNANPLEVSNNAVTLNNANLVIGTSGKGIDFSANTDDGGTSSATLFEDYEEGTFTPRLEGSTNGATYNSTGTGHYTKIGNICHVMIRFNGVDLDNNAAGAAKITQLPYTASAGGSASTVAGITSNFEFHNVVFNEDYKYSFYVNNNGTALMGLRSRNGTAWQDWPIDDFESSAVYIDLHATYRTT